jgi:hypothetical protein
MIAAFCTCTDLECPLHPTRHDKGCTPCISKNLKQSEIPSCFFNSIGAKASEGSSFEAFAGHVVKRSGGQ